MNLIGLLFFGVVLAGLFLAGRQVLIEVKARARHLSQLQNLRARFLDIRALMSDNSRYFRFSRFAQLAEKIEKIRLQVQHIKALSVRRQQKELLLEIDNFVREMPAFREKLNQAYMRREMNAAGPIFKDSLGRPLLTEDQAFAALSDDDRNLIVAGAGSGKTRVIDFKVRYLVHYKKIDPSRILLLSFSRKSAQDLIEKISVTVPEIEARTIHSFALQIARPKNRKIFDDRQKEMETFIFKALVQTLQDHRIFKSFYTFYEKFFTALKPMIFYENLDDLREDLRKLNSKLIETPDRFGEIKARRALRTLKGDYVRSIDERYIADFLYLHEVKYEYERPYPTDPDYEPDFYLTDYGVYLEHFAITNSGRPPEYFKDPDKYLEGMRWKRELHKRQKTKLIESYSYLLNAGETADYLTTLFEKHGIVLKAEDSGLDLYQKISREFGRVFVKFYQMYKLSGLSMGEIRHRHTEVKFQLFLEVFERFLEHFQRLVQQEHKMDFNDMIIEAIKKYELGTGRSFDYIIVDEFQDTSNLALKLLDQVVADNPQTSFLSVGDDWQSIYAFNGSDVMILSDFERRYEGSALRALNDNFRSHPKIVELGRQFISKNKSQIQKNVRSGCQDFESSEVGFLTLAQIRGKIEAIPKKESILILYRYNEDGPVIAADFRDFFELDRSRKPVRRLGCERRISMMTIHASKGLEAQHVFVVFPEGGRRKFPSEMEDHFVFEMLKSKAETYPFAEERRLMYVAITRAQQNLYFVSPKEDPQSIFWDELKELAEANGY